MQAPETVSEMMQYEASDDCVAKRATTSEDPSLHGLLQILIPLQPYPRYETPFDNTKKRSTALSCLPSSQAQRIR